MSAASWMSKRLTCDSFGNVIFSPDSGGGPTPPVLPAGPTIGNCGPDRPPANRSRLRAKAKPRLTIGTCGPTIFGSPVPDGPLSSWESRLRRRLARTGSTESVLTWRASVTPAGRPLSRLVPSTRRTDATDFGSWHTPLASDGTKLDAHLPAIDKRIAAGREIGLAMQARLETARAVWPTPTSLAPAKNGNNEAGNSAGLVAIRAHALAMWPTPRLQDSKHGPATPYELSRDESKDLLHVRAARAIGMALASSPDTTEKPGALNHQFVCWLMGYPPEWDACAPTETRSSRRSRRK